MSQLTTVAIIGSAGRKEDANKISAELYEKMILKAREIIEVEWKIDWKDITLVSGAAAFSDHIAVSLFQKTNSKLKLHFPCAWDEKNQQFQASSSTGQYANLLHRNFSKKCFAAKTPQEENRSLQELHSLFDCKQVTIDTSKSGFLARNTEVAKAQYLIAFTFGDLSSSAPAPGSGTYNTWAKHVKSTKSAARKHVNLSLLLEELGTFL